MGRIPETKAYPTYAFLALLQTVDDHKMCSPSGAMSQCKLKRLAGVPGDGCLTLRYSLCFSLTDGFLARYLQLEVFHLMYFAVARRNFRTLTCVRVHSAENPGITGRSQGLQAYPRPWDGLAGFFGHEPVVGFLLVHAK